MENERNETIQNLYPPLLDENLKIYKSQNVEEFEKSKKNEHFFDKNARKSEKNENSGFNLNNMMSLLQNTNNNDMLSAMLAMGNKNPKMTEMISALSKSKQKPSTTTQHEPTYEEF